jgi:hypothetical protein
LTPNTMTDGVRLYGGFECATWTYSTTRSAQVVSLLENIALQIDGLKEGAYIENMSFQAADGLGNDASSYGAFVRNSKNVVLRRVELKAGAGKPGLASPEQTASGPNGDVAGAAPSGSPFTCVASPDPLPKGGTWSAETACHSQGGPGGSGTKSTGTALPGGAGIPTVNVHPIEDIDNGGPGATDGGKGKDGLDGTMGDPGTLGGPANPKGSFSQEGFAVASGNAGGDGYPGQGGGGGGASKGNGTCFGASGGAGGMGGCGGSGGKGGEGGGASIGIFAWNSGLELIECSVASSGGGAGGVGGKGGGGGAGAGGGLGGQGSQVDGIAAAGKGGLGGPGGNGGSGSGGTGGPSYALVYSGAKPVYTAPDTSLIFGAPGAAGIGGQVLTEKAPDGAMGEAKAELEVK